MLNLQTVTPTPAYADTINSQFHKKQSHYVNVAQRLAETINKEKWKAQALADAVINFKSSHPHVKTWSDFTFCRADVTTLDNIEIDITMQRIVDLMHVCNILDRFKQLLVMPICVYEDPSRPGKYICWDGQHTSLVLYALAQYALGEDYSKCQVPIVVYASHLKSEMRNSFITINGPEGRKALDPIDRVHQMIYGVRTDGGTHPDWLLIEQKQQAIENAKMFLTHPKFGDDKMPGAYSRLDEFLDTKNYPLEITQYFCKYFHNVCGSSRPVQPKESWMLYDYFKYCRQKGITVDDAYIKGVAKSLKIAAFGNDFDAIKFYTRAKESYQEWWRANKPNPDGTLWGITYNENRIAMTFLFEQIRKNFSGDVPTFTIPLWPVPAKDLF